VFNEAGIRKAVTSIIKAIGDDPEGELMADLAAVKQALS